MRIKRSFEASLIGRPNSDQARILKFEPDRFSGAKSGQPHVIDFGLAKRDAVEITMMMDGQMLRTRA